MLYRDENTQEILECYQIKIISDPELEKDIFSSNQPLLDALIALHDNRELAAKLYNLVFVANNQHFPHILIAHLPIANTVECIPVFEQEEHTGPNNFVLPISDMLIITREWHDKLLFWVQRTFEVNDGQGIIRIINDDQSNALIIKKPVAINWPDCRGSIGEYYAVSSYETQQREELTRQLDEVLVTGNKSEILKQTGIFLKLFETGKYTVHLGTLKLKGSDIIFDRDSKSLPKNKDDFAYNFYPYGENWVYLASRTKDSIDPQRVAYYEGLIRNGLRPKVVVYTHYLSHDFSYCNYYIIDGHHKLLAYINLKIDSHDVHISKECYEEKMSNEMLISALSILNPEAFNHYLLHSSEENLSGLLSSEVTDALDRVLRTEKNFDTSITQNIRKAYLDPAYRQWAEQRLDVIRTNKHINKGLSLYFVHKRPEDRHGMWLRYPINSLTDFENWKEVFLEGKQLSIEMENMLRPRLQHRTEPQNITQRHFKPLEADNWFSTREVFLLIVIFLGLIQLMIKGC